MSMTMDGLARAFCRCLKHVRTVRSPWVRGRVTMLLQRFQFNWMDLFSSITIETLAFCNRHCEFCPNNEKYPPRQKGMLSREQYDRIIRELGELNYAGRISPHLYGEPLLDKRLPELVMAARQACPFAQITVMSNGDFLTREILLTLVGAGMDEIYVTNYDERDNATVTALQRDFPRHVSFRNFRDVEKRNKAGLLLNVEKAEENPRPCLRPGNQLVINWEGNAVLCCNDYYGKHVIGQVNNASLLELWRSSRLQKFRETLSKEGGRLTVDICRYCDG